MLTLCMDTAYKYLSLALIKDDEVIAAYDEECFKHQSEEIFVRLKELFKKVNLDPLAIDSICISEGPGSYTGVRIAMTIAKVIGSIQKLDVYTISTLNLYANDEEDALVIMDARAKRAYVGQYDRSRPLVKDSVQELDQIDLNHKNLYGDLSLFGPEDKMCTISKAFLNTKHAWKKVDNIDFLHPLYLKDSEAYHS